MKSDLPFVENIIHFSFWTSSCLYSLYRLFSAQTELLKQKPELYYEVKDLNPGWRLISRLNDESDIEWTTWKYFINTSWFYMLIQFFISEILRRTHISLLRFWYIFSSVLFLICYMGIRQLLIILIQPILFSIIVFSGGKRVSIWLTSLFLLAGYNSLKYNFLFWNILDAENLEDEEVFVMLYGIAWVELRCISFSLDYVEKIEKCEISKAEDSIIEYKKIDMSISENLLNMFSYVLYLPVLFVGPIILYEEFERSFNVRYENLLLRLKRFIFDMMLFQMYTKLLELAFHFIYFNAMHNHIKAIQELPSLALCGGGLWMGLVFHMKYVVSYGTTAAYSRLDNIDPPPTPRCIARIHIYSQMWRYFDVGLYRFLLKYIYKPVFSALSESITMNKTSCKLISSLATFIFILLWHGTMLNILIWSGLNYLGIVLEYFGKAIAETETYKQFKVNVLKSNAMEVRFKAFICTPLLGLSAISNFYLFADTDVGNLYFELLKWPSLHNFVIVYMSLYCSCHVAIALQDVCSRTDAKKKEIKVIL